jgi:hypothetical protein
LGSTDVIVPEDLPDQFFERETANASLPSYHEALNKTKRDLLERAFARAAAITNRRRRRSASAKPMSTGCWRT